MQTGGVVYLQFNLKNMTSSNEHFLLRQFPQILVFLSLKYEPGHIVNG